MISETPTLQATVPLIDKASEMIGHDSAYAYEHAGVQATRYGPMLSRILSASGRVTVIPLSNTICATPAPTCTVQKSTALMSPSTVRLGMGDPLQRMEHGRRLAQTSNYISRFRASSKIPATLKSRFDIATRLLHSL